MVVKMVGAGVVGVGIKQATMSVLLLVLPSELTQVLMKTT
jgi:hypothetical protein